MIDANGTEVSQGRVQVNDTTMRISLKPLNAGIYKVNWRAVSPTPTRSRAILLFASAPNDVAYWPFATYCSAALIPSLTAYSGSRGWAGPVVPVAFDPEPT